MIPSKLQVLVVCEPDCSFSSFVVARVGECVAIRQGLSDPDWSQTVVVMRRGSDASMHAGAFRSAGAAVRLISEEDYPSSFSKYRDDISKVIIEEVSKADGLMVGFWNGRHRSLRPVFSCAKAANLERYQIFFSDADGGQLSFDEILGE